MLDHGLFLAQRPEEGGAGLNLYYLPDTWVGYFVEVGVDEAHEGLVVRSSFRTTRLLEAYVLGGCSCLRGGREKAPLVRILTSDEYLADANTIPLNLQTLK